MRRTTHFVVSAFVLASVLVAPKQSASADPPQLFVVDTTEDVSDRAVGDGVCEDFSGNCSLRAAIQETGAGKVSVVEVAVTGRIQLRGGDLDVYGDVTIDGANLVGGRAGASENDRLFDVHPGAALTLTHSRLREGLPERGADGGAIRSRGDVSLADVSIESSRTRDGGDGGAIHAAGGVLDMRNVVIVGNEADGDGGGLFVAGDPGDLSTVTLSDNRASGDGGGAAIDLSGVSTNVNGTFEDNRAGHDGGGLYLRGAGPGTTVSGLSARNEAGSAGGGVALPDATGIGRVETALNNNTAQLGGGLWADGPEDMAIAARVRGNKAFEAGGGLWLRGGSAAILRTVTNNVAEGPAPADGAGIYAVDVDLSLVFATVARNRASGSGGGLRAIGGTVAVDEPRIKSNRAGGDGAGLSLLDVERVQVNDGQVRTNYADGDGGNFYVDGTVAIALSITGSKIFDARARQGGGLWLGPTVTADIRDGDIQSNFARGDADVGGGGLYVAGADVTIDQTMVRQNASTAAGGGILLADGRVDILRSMVNGSRAVTEGAGIAVYSGELVVRGATRNTFNVLTGPDSRGGGYYLGGGTTSISNGSLRKNTAVAAGGGVFCDIGATVAIQHVTPKENSAAIGPNVFNQGGDCNVKGQPVVPGTGF